jgi:serine/threonine-protein kinase
LKLLSKAHLHSEEREAWLERFRREARVTSRLSSPYTVRIYDYGINQVGAAYFVMELLNGEDLHSYVRRTGSMSPKQVIAVALQICDSLGEAHDLGLVHRDVKPANVLLVRNAERTQIKVLDFGLADFAERLSTPEHADGRFSGTPAFMPPEAFLGRPIDARSDIYELGCLLYFLLSGHNVFERSSLAALAIAHVRETPANLTRGGHELVPPALAAVVARCLEKSPDDRYASIDELEEDLLMVQDVLEGWRASWPSSEQVLVTPPAP